MESWPTADLGDDEIKNLAKIVVDFNRERGVLDDSDLLEIVIRAYLAGKATVTWANLPLAAEGIVH
jgi:hypothetical protein